MHCQTSRTRYWPPCIFRSSGGADMSQPAVSGTYDRRGHENLDRAFGADRFGEVSERVARFFGTPKYIVGQSVLVLIWILLNTLAIRYRWDPYPFILLNLAFS